MRLAFILTFLALPVLAADRITASFSITNAPTTNGQTLTVNGNVRTWTNNVQIATSQIGTNATIAGSKTNAFNQIALNPFSQVTIVDRGSTNFDLVGASGVVMTVTPSAGYALVTYSTQTVASMVGVRVPISSEPSGVQQTNIASALVKGQNDLSTDSFYENAIAVQNLVGITNAQTITGRKTYTGSNFFNLVYLANPVSTNMTNYGAAISSPGSGAGSEQFGSGAAASNTGSTAAGNGSVASGNISAAFGYGATASGGNSTAIGTGAAASGSSSSAFGTSATAGGFASSTAIGAGAAATAANQVRLGTATETVSIPGGLNVVGAISQFNAAGTNNFAAESDVAFARKSISSLANGVNAAVPVGTNVYVQVSGPSSAFSIAGIANGRDGKLLILVNETGQNMTISHDSGSDATAANRIYTMTGSDHATTGNGAAILIYNGAEARWILLSLNP